MSSMLVISNEISLIETISRTKSIFGFNNTVLKILSEVTILRAVAMSKMLMFSDYC